MQYKAIIALIEKLFKMDIEETILLKEIYTKFLK